MLGAAILGCAVAMPTHVDSTASSNQLLKLNQWDWHQAIEAPRQGFLERNKQQAPERQPEVRQQVDRQRRDEQQLYERQRREHNATTRARTTPAGRTDARRLQRQQTQRFKAQSNNLRLQQDIQRRATAR
jgi:hypothetical protein